MKKLTTFLFDLDIFFETKNNEKVCEICFKILKKNISVHFLQNNRMIIMLIVEYNEIKTFYSNDIDEFLTQIAIYNKIATECQQQIVVDYI